MAESIVEVVDRIVSVPVCRVISAVDVAFLRSRSDEVKRYIEERRSNIKNITLHFAREIFEARLRLSRFESTHREIMDYEEAEEYNRILRRMTGAVRLLESYSPPSGEAIQNLDKVLSRLE